MLSVARHLLFLVESEQQQILRFAPSKVARRPFVFNTAIDRDFHGHWWAERPCNTRDDIV